MSSIVAMSYLRELQQKVHRTGRMVGWARLSRLALATIVLCSLFVPVVSEFATEQHYLLDTPTRRLIGNANANLSAKFSFDAQHQQWVFNKDAMPKNGKLQPGQMPPEQILKSQLGGAGKHDQSLYSVTLPADAKEGITYYDSNTQLSFSLLPEFKVSSGQERQGRLIYPFGDGGKLVYTAKSNGMQEDIVLSHEIGDSALFTYKFNLPNTLEARPMDDGLIGIYSADPALFGNISYGSDADQERVMEARE